MVGLVIAYYYFVRWIHRTLDAGPLVVIATAMTAIFTIGLGDGNGEGVSAYSVFNRGFQQILGSVDVEALVQQYAGGGLAVQAQQAQAQGNMVDREYAREAPPAAAAAAAHADENSDADDDDDPQDGRNNRARRSNKKNRNRDRRQRDAEVRREMERQRQAAAAMGFGGDGDEDVAAMNRLIEEQVFLAEQQDDQENG